MLDNEVSSFAEPTGDTSGIDADALMSQIETTGSTGPAMSEAPAPQTNAQPAAAPAAQDLEFTWNGRQIKAPITDPRIKQWASQGYDYAQRMAEFNKQQEDLKAESQKWSELKDRYSPVEDYITKNPDWWNHVQSQYQQQIAQQGLGSDPNNPIVQKLSAYDQKLSQVEQFIQSQVAEKQAIQRQEEDSKLETEIKSIRDAYANLDWNGIDETGLSLELKVLQHAQQIGTTSFRAAFRDMMHEPLTKLAEERAKENVVKERQKQTKLGLLGKSPAPKTGLTEAQDIKRKSYDQLLREGAEEMGIKLG
jgi:hypothetical protein